MFQVPLVTSDSAVSLKGFWTSILLYHDRPHLANTKLGTASSVLLCQIDLDRKNLQCVNQIFRSEALLYEVRKLQSDLSKISIDFVKNICETHDKDVKIVPKTWDEFKQSTDGAFVSIRVLVGRHKGQKCVEVVVFDKKEKIVSFIAVEEANEPAMAPPFAYHIELTSDGQLRIVLDNFEDADSKYAGWLKEQLFPKLIKWTNVNTEKTIPSLSLVEPDYYYETYLNLKEKYAEKFVKKWPEKYKDDSPKLVHEDIGIAAYLISLWHKLNCKDIKFVDLGCGNGLLTHLLNCEGYSGYGLDLRPYKNWEFFQPHADLRVGAVTPEFKDPELTWLIGNHPDELALWIPLMALKSSPRTNFFILPCCVRDFNGQKFVRTAKLSRYENYIGYIENFCKVCGFDVGKDKLRVPAMKRTCLVGISKGPLDELSLNKINEYIKVHLKSEFVPRDPIEKVRNCTHLNKDLIKKIVNLVIKELLKIENFKLHTYDGKPWNCGGSISLPELVKLVPSDDLKLLKNQFNGLQTLLKNHRYLFVIQKGCVSLRLPLKLDANSAKYRSKPCWFNTNHPNGCLFDAETCSSKH